MAQTTHRTLLWFNHDLRTHDNEALLLAAQGSKELMCVFCKNTSSGRTNRHGLLAMGKLREQFLMDSLVALDQALRKLRQNLVVIEGEPHSSISKLIDTHEVTRVVRSWHPGYDENQQWHFLQESHSSVVFETAQTFTLFNNGQLPKECPFPSSFSAFRKQVSGITPEAPAQPPLVLPLPIRVNATPPQPISNRQKLMFKGGEWHALAHIQQYFQSHSPSQYKKTRNELEGWSVSCKFSPWLANGSLSVKEVFKQLSSYEREHGANESTEWIYFELLWREYFQWYANHYGKQLFSFEGINNSKPLSTFYPQRFKQWCSGQTPWPIVNACMEELNHTGYISNRGRQIVASCLVNELAIDWRWGARYFEQQLIDYDVAINWGNWQYIAGVGADPRGGRHFDLDKQTRIYDPEHQFINKWTSLDKVQGADSVDAADWPIEKHE